MVSRVVKFIDKESSIKVTKVWGSEGWGVVNDDKVSVCDNENSGNTVDSEDGCTTF